MPDDLRAYYPRDYYSFPTTLRDRVAAAEPERNKLDLLSNYVGKGSVLEIGPGGGGFAFLAQSAGYDVTAIEMDGTSCRYLEQEVGIKVIQTDDPCTAMQSSADKYDAIALWHVLEHLREPVDVLVAAARLLRPGGSIILAVPNPEALQLRVFKRFWTHLDAPRHLCLVPSARLASVLTGLGLKIVLHTSTDVGGLAWDIFGWQYSAANVVLARIPWLRRHRTLLMFRPLAVVAAGLARSIEQRGGRGTTYTLVATRHYD